MASDDSSKTAKAPRTILVTGGSGLVGWGVRIALEEELLRAQNGKQTDPSTVAPPPDPLKFDFDRLKFQSTLRVGEDTWIFMRSSDCDLKYAYVLTPLFSSLHAPNFSYTEVSEVPHLFHQLV